jgi:hypothetical protein
MPVQEFTVKPRHLEGAARGRQAGRHAPRAAVDLGPGQRVAVDDVRVMKELKAKGVEADSAGTTRDAQGPRAGAQDLGRLVEEGSRSPRRAYDSQVAWLRDLGLIA